MPPENSNRAPGDLTAGSPGGSSRKKKQPQLTTDAASFTKALPTLEQYPPTAGVAKRKSNLFNRRSRQSRPSESPDRAKQNARPKQPEAAPRRKAMAVSVMNFAGNSSFSQERPVQKLTFREKTHIFMEMPSSSRGAFILSLITALVVTASIMIMTIETTACRQQGVREHGCYLWLPVKKSMIWFWLEMSVTMVFSIEVLTRLAVTPNLHQTWREHSMVILIDIGTILPWYLELVLRLATGGDIDEHDRLLQFLQTTRVLRLLKLARHYSGSAILYKALTMSVEALLVPGFFLVVAWIILSSVMYTIEHDPDDGDEDFTSIPKASWFIMVTILTVGYGDMTPGTEGGKMVSIAAMVFGVLFTAMPLAIVGNNFVIVWSAKEKLQVFNEIRELLHMKKMSMFSIMGLFQTFDQDKNQKIDFFEFTKALNELGANATKNSLRTLWVTLDSNGDGLIDYQEFCSMMFADLKAMNESLINGTPLLEVVTRQKKRSSVISKSRASFRGSSKQAVVPATVTGGWRNIRNAVSASSAFVHNRHTPSESVDEVNEEAQGAVNAGAPGREGERPEVEGGASMRLQNQRHKAGQLSMTAAGAPLPNSQGAGRGKMGVDAAMLMGVMREMKREMGALKGEVSALRRVVHGPAHSGNDGGEGGLQPTWVAQPPRTQEAEGSNQVESIDSWPP